MANETVPSHGASGALERRLATILTADVAGYSRMMGENEEATVQTLRGHRAVFDALLQQHHGRVFNTAGDAILAEFPSAVEAVRCATEIQAALQTRNENLPPERKMLFRMGINLGDVLVQDGDLLGDGVNVAARIQTIAEPGGICISGSVYDQIQNKLSLQFKPLGGQNLKNIAQPVRTFSITHGESSALPSATPRARGGRLRAAALATVAVGLVAGTGFWFYRDHDRAPRGAEPKPVQDAGDATPPPAASEGGVKPEAAAPVRAAAAAGRVGTAAAPTGPTAGSAADRTPPTPSPSGVSAADGLYRGQVCNFPQDVARKTCWRAPLQVQNGRAEATWQLLLAGREARLHAVIAPDGSVTATMDGWKVTEGTPMAGAMSGTVANGHVDLSGRWSNGIRVEGHWERRR